MPRKKKDDTMAASKPAANKKTKNADPYYIRRPHLVCAEWAEQFVGLRMKVQNNWWEGCNGLHYHNGRIDSYNSNKAFWMLDLDDKTDNQIYKMNWGTVFKDAN